MQDGANLTQGMRRAVCPQDTVIVRDENGVIVVETVTEWGKARQRVNVPDGWRVEVRRGGLVDKPPAVGDNSEQ